jgi:thiol-disulfide isomerase/thioredoxin
MKKILFVLAASAFVMSCKNLADNEYEITGTVDPSLNGKNLILEKQGAMSFEPVDTVKIEDGKFLFKGTVKEPEFHFISIEGKPDQKVDLILEHGELAIEIDKDSIFKSKKSGTYNNDKLVEYVEMTKGFKKEEDAFKKKNMEAYMAAFQKQDQATMDNLNNQFKAIKEKREKKDLEFIKANPKAYINIFLVGQVAGTKSPEEAKKLFNSLDPELKKTTKGKELAKAFSDAPAIPAPAPAAPAEAPGKSNAEVGTTAPAFSANTPAGKKLSLKEAMGKVTIIDFWASWCGPCRKENPNVVALYNEYHAKGLNIIGVSLDKPGEADKWKKAIADDKLIWNHVSNLMFWDEPIAQQYGVQSIPATFVLDASGKIVAKDLRGAELKAKVAELLAK